MLFGMFSLSEFMRAAANSTVPFRFVSRPSGCLEGGQAALTVVMPAVRDFQITVVNHAQTHGAFPTLLQGCSHFKELSLDMGRN